MYRQRRQQPKIVESIVEKARTGWYDALDRTAQGVGMAGAVTRAYGSTTTEELTCFQTISSDR